MKIIIIKKKKFKVEEQVEEVLEEQHWNNNNKKLCGSKAEVKNESGTKKQRRKSNMRYPTSLHKYGRHSSKIGGQLEHLGRAKQ